MSIKKELTDAELENVTGGVGQSNEDDIDKESNEVNGTPWSVSYKKSTDGIFALRKWHYLGKISGLIKAERKGKSWCYAHDYVYIGVKNKKQN